MGAHDAGWTALEVGAVVTALVAGSGYLAAVVVARRRGRWPVRRTACWLLGLTCALAAVVGPLADASRTGFTAHMTGHLLLGMLGPLLLVRAAPVTVLLRALPVSRARVLGRVLRSRPLRVVTHPVVAGGLGAGGMWWLYTSSLYATMHHEPWVHAVVHVHVLVGGYLFTASVVGVDPDPHRSPLAVRSAALVAFVAAHSVLATCLWAHPPAGTSTVDGQRGALVMYLGGDVVDVALMVLLLAGWYRAAAPRASSHEPHPSHSARTSVPIPGKFPGPGADPQVYLRIRHPTRARTQRG